MKTYPILRDGQLFAFEIDNQFLGRRGAVKVISRIPGVRVIRNSTTPFFGEDEFCVFEVSGHQFSIDEPFGDNSRYWIGAQPPETTPQILLIREHFDKHNPVTGKLLAFLASILAVFLVYKAILCTAC